MNRGTAFEPAPLQAWRKSVVAHHRPAVSATSMPIATPSESRCKRISDDPCYSLRADLADTSAIVETPTAATPDPLAWEPIVGAALIAKSREHSYAWSRF